MPTYSLCLKDPRIILRVCRMAISKDFYYNNSFYNLCKESLLYTLQYEVPKEHYVYIGSMPFVLIFTQNPVYFSAMIRCCQIILYHVLIYMNDNSYNEI